MRLLLNRLKKNPFFYILIIELLFLILTPVNYYYNKLPLPSISATLNNNYNLANTCLAGFLLSLLLLPIKNKEGIIFIAFGLILEIIIWSTHGIESTLLANFLLCGFGLYASFLTYIIIRTINCIKNKNTDECIRNIEILTLYTAMTILYGTSAGSYSIYDPVYDPMLFAADGLTGVQPSFLVTAFVLKRRWLTILMIIIYTYLPTWMLLAQAFAYRTANRDPNSAPPFIPAVAYIITAVLGTTAYTYFPGVGTEVYLGSDIFPFGSIPQLFHLPEAVIILNGAPRNAMPSLHLSFIVCSYMAVSRMSVKIQLVYAFLALGTLFSAFAIGKHWLSDFLVAMPFVAACISLVSFKTIVSIRCAIAAFGSLTSMGMMYILKNHIDIVLSHSSLYLQTVAAIQIISFICLWLLASHRFQKR